MDSPFFSAIYGAILLIILVMRTCINVWMSSNFGQIRQLTTEIAALEHLKNRCCHFFSIHFKFVDKEYMHNILDKSSNFGQVGPTTMEEAALERLKISHRLIMGKCISTLSWLFFVRSFSYLQVIRT